MSHSFNRQCSHVERILSALGVVRCSDLVVRDLVIEAVKVAWWAVEGCQAANRCWRKTLSRHADSQRFLEHKHMSILELHCPSVPLSLPIGW